MARSRNQLQEILQDGVTRFVQQMTGTINDFLQEQMPDPKTFSTKGATAGRKGPSRKGKIRPCIAPKCKQPSKGPRFHFLCENHMKAPKRDWMVWAGKAEAKPAAKPAQPAKKPKSKPKAAAKPVAAKPAAKPAKPAPAKKPKPAVKAAAPVKKPATKPAKAPKPAKAVVAAPAAPPVNGAPAAPEATS